MSERTSDSVQEREENKEYADALGLRYAEESDKLVKVTSEEEEALQRQIKKALVGLSHSTGEEYERHLRSFFEGYQDLLCLKIAEEVTREAARRRFEKDLKILGVDDFYEEEVPAPLKESIKRTRALALLVLAAGSFLSGCASQDARFAGVLIGDNLLHNTSTGEYYDYQTNKLLSRDDAMIRIRKDFVDVKDRFVSDLVSDLWEHKKEIKKNRSSLVKAGLSEKEIEAYFKNIEMLIALQRDSKFIDNVIRELFELHDIYSEERVFRMLYDRLRMQIGSITYEVDRPGVMASYSPSTGTIKMDIKDSLDFKEFKHSFLHELAHHFEGTSFRGELSEGLNESLIMNSKDHLKTLPSYYSSTAFSTLLRLLAPQIERYFLLLRTDVWSKEEFIKHTVKDFPAALSSQEASRLKGLLKKALSLQSVHVARNPSLPNLPTDRFDDCSGVLIDLCLEKGFDLEKLLKKKQVNLYVKEYLQEVISLKKCILKAKSTFKRSK